MLQDDMDRRFDYHRPDEAAAARHERVRAAHKQLAEALDSELPEGREKALVFTNIEQSMFWANAAIARAGGAGERTS